MYRNITYHIDNNWHGQITLYTWEDDGTPVKKTYPHKSHLYIESPNGKEKSIFGTNLIRKTFDSIVDRNKFLRSVGNIKIFESLPPIREFLIEKYGGEQEKPDFAKHELRTHFIDIEVAVGQNTKYKSSRLIKIKKITNQKESKMTINDFENNHNPKSYKVWDEEKKRWTNLNSSCYVDNSFPHPQQAAFAINCLTVYDNLTEKYYCWVLKNKKWCDDDLKLPNRKDTIFNVFNSESEMLKDYLNWHRGNYPDIISGWNIESFDIPYIVNRIEMLLGNIVQLLSPTESIKKEIIQHRGSSVATQVCTLEGITTLDYIFLYRNKFAPTVGKKSSYKLGDVAQDEVGATKLDQGGLTFKEFYIKDFSKFILYNIIDVELVVKLDKKFKFINLARKICNLGLVEFAAISKSSPYITGALVLEARANNMILQSRSGINTDIDISFEGGYVYKPQLKAYYNGVASLDLNSLYPNIMINLNISPETKIGKIIDTNEDTGDVTIRMVNNKLKVFSKTDIEKLRGKVTISENGVLYVNPDIKKGIIPKFLERLYIDRTADKDLMLKKRQQMNKISDFILDLKLQLKTTPSNKKNILLQINKLNAGYTKLEIEADNLNASQGAKKLILNTTYGQLASKYFCLFDMDNAAAITNSGQKILKESVKYLNQYFRDKYKLDHDYDVTIYADTDSIYFDASLMVKNILGDKFNKLNLNVKNKLNDINVHVKNMYASNEISKDMTLEYDKLNQIYIKANSKLWSKQNVKDICNFIDNEFVTKVNENCYRITNRLFMSPVKNIKFKRETFCSCAVFLRKKRYILHVLNDEGVMVDKWKPVGIDIKKSELPTKIKSSLKKIIFTGIEQQWSNDRYTSEIDKVWKVFTTLRPNDLAFHKGYNTVKYSNGFLEVMKGTGIHAKSALFYNQLIDKLDLKHKYDEIFEGDIIRYMYVDDINEYMLKSIGWPGGDEFPKEFEKIFNTDYRTMFTKTVLKPLDGFIEALGWSYKHPADELVIDLMSL